MISASKEPSLGNMDDINGPLSHAKADTRDAWNKVIDAKEELQKAAHRAGRKVRGYIDTAGEEISHATDTVTTQIRTKPVQSSIVALAVGFVIGRLLRL